MDTSDSVLLRKVVREGGRSEVDRKEKEENGSF
jgi:hypothetical protein